MIVTRQAKIDELEIVKKVVKLDFGKDSSPLFLYKGTRCASL